MTFTVRQLKHEPKKRSFPWMRFLGSVFNVGAPLIAVLYSRKKHREEEIEKRRVTLLKKLLLVLIAVLCALLLLVGVVKGLTAVYTLGFGDIAAITGAAPAADTRGNINILLLGQGDANHDGKDLTDTIMVASIDPEDTHSVMLLSLPRDLYFLKTAKMGKGRLNSLYRDYKSYLRFQKGMESTEASMEAMQELARELGTSLNIDIQHVAKVDFVGFVKIVDLLEGVDVSVPQDIVDTEYPDGDWGYETFELSAGQQNLDGETALKYARSRHSSSDFDRSARQQQILKAIGDKARASGILKDPMKMSSIARVLSEHIETSLSLREMIGLAEISRSVDTSRIVPMQINDRNGLYETITLPGGFLYTPPRDLFDGASVLLPVSIPEFPITWKQIQTLTLLMMHQRSVYLAKPEIAVLNAGAPSGTARRLGNELTRYGFTVSNIANASLDDQPTSSVSVLNENDAALGSFFGVLLDIEQSALPSLPPEEVAQITIILGEDFAYSPLQNLVPQLP